MLDLIIEEVKNARKGNNRPWIYDENGNIKDDVLVVDVLPILESLKDYECTLFDADYIFENGEEIECGNTYNWSANISNDINYQVYKIDNLYFAVVMVHLLGDVRGNYTDYFVIDMGNFNSFVEFLYDYCDEKLYDYKEINDRYVADLFALSEVYTVYDTEIGDDIGEFYDIEVADLLKNIEKVY